MTEKQCNAAKREARLAVTDMKVTLEFSIRLLEDYRGDMKIEMQDLNRTIKSAKSKLKKLDEKLKG